MLLYNSLKTKKENKNWKKKKRKFKTYLSKQTRQRVFSSTIQLRGILKIYLEEQLLIQYFMIKLLILLKVHNDGYQRDFVSMVYTFFEKKYATHPKKSSVISTHIKKGINFRAVLVSEK